MADDGKKNAQAKRLEEMRQRMRSSRSPDKQRTRTPAGGGPTTPGNEQLDMMRERRRTAMAEATAKKKERELNKQVDERKKEREQVPVSETFLLDEDVLMAVRRPMRGALIP